MGIGDKLLAIGDAWKRYQADPRKKVAIGSGVDIDLTDYDLHWGLDFLATPDDLWDGTPVDWVISYPGKRPYIDYTAMHQALCARQGYNVVLRPKRLAKRLGHYIFNSNYRPTPAPIRLKPDEIARAASFGDEPYVVIEGFIKSAAPPSKQWPVERFQRVADELGKSVRVIQLGPPDTRRLRGVEHHITNSFRDALGYLSGAALYVGPEGGLHHGAAALGRRAVVLYGGYISPDITGYPDLHVNLTGGVGQHCGTRMGMCPHCYSAFKRITVDEVVGHAQRLLAGEAP